MSSPSTHSASPIPASTAENLATRINEEAITLIKAAKAAEAAAAAGQDGAESTVPPSSDIESAQEIIPGAEVAST